MPYGTANLNSEYVGKERERFSLDLIKINDVIMHLCFHVQMQFLKARVGTLNQPLHFLFGRGKECINSGVLGIIRALFAS